LPSSKSFREAFAEVCEDSYPSEEAGSTAALHRRLRNAFLKILPDIPQAQDQLDQLLSSDVSLGTLTDIISYMMDIELEAKEALLMETDVHRRAELLLEHLAAASSESQPGAAGACPFPPQFSRN